jgi:hypothetical protein
MLTADDGRVLFEVLKRDADPMTWNTCDPFGRFLVPTPLKAALISFVLTGFCLMITLRTNLSFDPNITRDGGRCCGHLEHQVFHWLPATHEPTGFSARRSRDFGIAETR